MIQSPWEESDQSVDGRLLAGGLRRKPLWGGSQNVRREGWKEALVGQVYSGILHSSKAARDRKRGNS